MIRVEQLKYEVGNFALQDINLQLQDGEYFVLLGPPGSGKSIFLECLCGLKKPSGGSIAINGVDVTYQEPRRRGIGYVPQDYGLFPHLSVKQNIAFGLKGCGDKEKRIRDVAEWLAIPNLLNRRIKGLSGGERQKVALARALVLEPKVLLLDEPVSALDEATRQDVCMDLKKLQQKLGITTVHISHNREEAFTVADRAAILRDGVLQQIGTMPELSRKPANEYVAKFMRCENIFHGRTTADGEHAVVQIGQTSLRIPQGSDGDIIIVIRPEAVQIRAQASDDTVNMLHAKIVNIQDRGVYNRVQLDGDLPLIAHVPTSPNTPFTFNEGSSVTVFIAPEAIHGLT